MIPKHKIDEIYDATRIEEVVGDYVSLKKRGANLLGLCPFHGEKTPSFTVSPTKGIYKCFGCSAGGNAVSFVMDLEQVSYPEALKQLAKKYSIEIEEQELNPEQKAALNKRESLYLLNEFAQTYFEDQYKSQLGELVAQAYTRDRKISKESVEKFHVGFLPDVKDGFAKHALKQGYSKELLQETGLSIFKDSNVYDRFRDRIIFPIHSLSGRVLGFGGRILKTDKKIAKYVNSPESEVYHKSKVLYGIFQAKRAIAKQDSCILVEGYTDVISFHQSGIEHVVSSSGTALTKEQVRLIKRFTNNLTVIFDGDSAGIKAALRGIDIILENGLNVQVLALPEGEDPDSFAKKHSSQELKTYIETKSTDFINFKIDLFQSSGNQNLAEKTKWLRSIVQSIAKVPDPLKRTILIQTAAPQLGLEEKVLFTELDLQLRNHHLEEKKEQERIAKRKAREEGFLPIDAQVPVPESTEPTRPSEQHLKLRIENQLLRILLKYANETLEIEVESESETEDNQFVKLTVFEFLHHEFQEEEFQFQSEVHQHIYAECLELWTSESKDKLVETLLRTDKPEQIKLISDLLYDEHQLADWERKEIYVAEEKSILNQLINQLIWRYQLENAKTFMLDIKTKIASTDENTDELFGEYMAYLAISQELQTRLGREV
ncbi:MAG: DNA primase [Flavobacteriales bacterium]